ncbi:MAG: PLDc N-terminal domain-containing protein [Pyrinomonadaceae bacterium]|nr:PLDc N-terminal domain-containing protein [Sphingobacteriaceae bacterium]
MEESFWFSYIMSLALPLLLLLSAFIILFSFIDIIKSDFKGSNTKLLWAFLVVFALPFGTLIYLLIGRKQKILKS